MTQRFRSRPVEVEAHLWNGDWGAFDAWADETCDEQAEQDGVMLGANGVLLIETLEGVMTAQMGDWIIRGVQGELYPCKPDIFAEKYEAVQP